MFLYNFIELGAAYAPNPLMRRDGEEFLMAAREENLGVVRRLYQRWGSEIIRSDIYLKAEHLAAYNEHNDVVCFLIEKKQDLMQI